MRVVIINMNTYRTILYISVIIIGFLINFISILIYNKKYHVLKFENIIISYMLFIIVFFICAKAGYIIINKNIIVNSKLFPNFFNFFIFGYAFIGGYLGILIYPFICSKIFKCNKLDIMKIYIPNSLLLYSILKIGCYINGCCGGNIPIQLIESFSSFIGYIFVCFLVKNNKCSVKISIIIFCTVRLVLSLFRIYDEVYQLIIIEIMSIIIIYYGFIIKTVKK